MSKTEAIENMIKVILSDDDKMISTDEYNKLIENAGSTEEDLYTLIFNYLLGRKQAEVVKNARF